VKVDFSPFSANNMPRKVSVDDWLSDDVKSTPDGSWETMMQRVAKFHHKHSFESPENNGHDMGYRLALTVEELGELSAAITKGKPKSEASEELADLLILILGHSLAMNVDLESEFHKKIDKIMLRESKRGGLGIRVTEYKGQT
jgi:NTP pyrophosphatase (non-canonical NTP hydrolase)